MSAPLEGLCVDACLSCFSKQLLLCVDYFVTVNNADYHGNVWRWSDLLLLLCMWRNQVRQGSFFLFSRWWLTNHLTRRKVEIRTLSCKTAQMCMLAWSFAACISDKYLNHITGIKNLAWAFIYIPSFNCNQRRLWRYCANAQPRQIIRC